MTTVAPKTQMIDRAALKAKLDKKETFHLWNVLTKEHYKPESNIPGSKWLPVDTITAELAKSSAPVNTDMIVVYCGGPACPASKQAAEKLQSLGYTNVFAYEGGLKDWSEGGFPLVKIA